MFRMEMEAAVSFGNGGFFIYKCKQRFENIKNLGREVLILARKKYVSAQEEELSTCEK